MLNWLFKRRKAPQELPGAETYRSGNAGRPAPRTSPLMPHAGDALIREVLPRVFQRTAKDFTPVAPLGLNGRAATMDAAISPLPDVWGVQNTVPAVVFSWFGAHSFIGHQACAILAQHWLIDKACSQAPKDAVQNGFTPVPTLPEGDVPPDLVKEITACNTRMDIVTQAREFARNARIFGIRHALFTVDGIDYEAPFNPDGVTPGSYKGISQIDPYWLTPEFNMEDMGAPGAMHFYEPTWWRLPGGQRVHRSHFVILRESEVPDILKPTYFYGGLPMPQLIFERVYAAERTADEAPELALTKRLVTMKGQIENYITDENEVTERLHAFNQIRSNFGFLTVGDDEDVTQIDTSLADFDALIMTQYQLVASIARTPATKLLGTTPKGFQATGEHESDSYDQELVSIQSNGMTPLTDRHHLLLCRSHFSEYPGLNITTSWNPVRKLKPGEVADINLKNAQTAQIEQAVGAISPDEERDRLKADPISAYQNLPDDVQEEDPLELGLPTAGGDSPQVPSMDGKNFKEEEHPRAGDGKFGSGGAGQKHAAREATPEAEKQRKLASVSIDFSRDNKLPGLNKEDLQALGKEDKPVLLKKNIIEKNLAHHPEVSRDEYSKIIGQSLYKPDGIFSGHDSKPYFNFMARVGADKSTVVLLEMAETKSHHEIVNLHWVSDAGRKRKEQK